MKYESTKDRVVSTVAIVTRLGVLLLCAGCMSLEQMAPPVGGEFRMVAARHSVDVATLELGRQIYLSDCVSCHSVEPIGRYSAEHWRNILPKMAGKTLLTRKSTEAVESYVTLALVLLDEGWTPESEVVTSRERILQESAPDAVAVRGSR